MKIFYILLGLLLLSAAFYFFPFKKVSEEYKNTKITLIEFADLLTGEITTLDKNIKVQVDLDNKSLSLNNSKVAFVNLAGFYEEYVHCPFEDRKLMLGDFAGKIIKPAVIPENFEEAEKDIVPNLMPWLWMENFINKSKQEKDKEEHIIASKDFSTAFKICLVWENKGNFVFIDHLQLSKWKKSFDEVYAVAIENLKKISVVNDWEKIDEGVYKSKWGDFNQHTRILFPNLFKEVSVKGNPVVFIVKRDLVIVTGSNDSLGLLKAAEISRKKSEEGRSFCGIAYELNNDQWIPFLPDKNDPSFKLLSHLQKTAKSYEYAEQKKSLGKIYNEIFVASYTLYEDDKRPDLRQSYSVWAEFIPALLPKTDYIHLLVRESLFSINVKRTVSVPWDIAFSIAGHLFTDMGTYPQRYKVENFPSEDELKLMEELLTQ